MERFAEMVNGYNYLTIYFQDMNFSRSLFMKWDFLKIQVWFLLQKYFIVCKKVCTPNGVGVVNCDIPF